MVLHQSATVDMSTAISSGVGGAIGTNGCHGTNERGEERQIVLRRVDDGVHDKHQMASLCVDVSGDANHHVVHWNILDKGCRDFSTAAPSHHSDRCRQTFFRQPLWGQREE